MTLSNETKKALKASAFKLKPVIMIGNRGLTPAVIKETNLALLAHELIKVKVNIGDRFERKTILEKLCQQSKAEFIGMIGRIGIVYREKNQTTV